MGHYSNIADKPRTLGATKLPFFPLLIGILLAPSSTITKYIESETNPKNFAPFSLHLILLFFLNLFIPILTYAYLPANKQGITLTLLAIIATLFFFCWLYITLEALILGLVGITLSPYQLISSIAYCGVPINFICLLLYFLNFATTGRFSIAELLLNGCIKNASIFYRCIPFLVALTLLWLMIVFYFVIRAITQSSDGRTFRLTISSLVPFVLSICLALTLSDTLRPGLMHLVFNLITSPNHLSCL